MNANRSALLASLTLAGCLMASSFASAQATKKVQIPPTAKEKTKAAAKELVDLNSAKAEELETLPGVGPATSRKIIDSRPHRTFADLSKAGINEATIEKLRPLATVKPLPPAVDVNADPIEQIETLPGIGPVLAKEIVATRPHKTYEDLGKLKGLGAEKIDALKGRVKFGEMAKPKAVIEKKTETVTKAMPKGKSESVTKTTKVVTETTKEHASKVPPGKKININTATADELQLLWGIGPARAGDHRRSYIQDHRRHQEGEGHQGFRVRQDQGRDHRQVIGRPR